MQAIFAFHPTDISVNPEWKVKMTTQEADPGFLLDLPKNLKLNSGLTNKSVESTLYFFKERKLNIQRLIYKANSFAKFLSKMTQLDEKGGHKKP